MNSVAKLLKVGDFVYSAFDRKPLKVTSLGGIGFHTTEGHFLYEDVRKLYFLTKIGYDDHKKSKCKYYAEFEGICCNGDCKPYVADACPYDNQSECRYYECEDGVKNDR